MDSFKVLKKLELVVPDNVVALPAWYRLEEQLNWYDNKSTQAQRNYKILKVGQMCLAIMIPGMSLLPPNYSAWATAIAGALIALFEAVQHLNQYSTLWITYRSTAEHLKHEKYLFLAGAGPYRDLADSEKVQRLSERVEEHVSTEHANWFNESRKPLRDQKGTGGQ